MRHLSTSTLLVVFAGCARPDPVRETPSVPHAPPRASAPPVASDGGGPLPSPAPRVVLSTNRPEHFLGENVLVHFCLENPTAAPVTIGVGGDYRGSSRSLRFKVEVRDADGRAMPDPDPEPFNLGGLGYSPTIQPGESWCQSLPLARYARIEAEGTYRITATHDLDWKPGTAPRGEMLLRLRMPNASDAERIVSAMRALPRDPSTSAGKRSIDYADFSALSHAVYLAPLEKLAATGDVDALYGIASIPTPEATRALVALVRHSNPDVAARAAQSLTWRLPDPALKGELGPRHPLLPQFAAQRRFLSERAYRSDLDPEVRALARALLSSGDDEAMKSGAFFLEAVGEATDAPLVVSALDRAIEKTRATPREAGIHPAPRGACQELLRALQVLGARGFRPSRPSASPGSPPGELAAWITARIPRPSGWEADLARALRHPIAYVRQLALEHAPAPLPPSLAPDLEANLRHTDVDVQLAAVGLVTRDKAARSGPTVLAVLASAKDPWLLRHAGEALRALGMHGARADALVRRLDDPAVMDEVLGMLLDLFDRGGRSSTAFDRATGAVLKAKWQAFLRARQADVSAGRPLSLDDAPKDLVPAGWTVHRNGKPDWP